MSMFTKVVDFNTQFGVKLHDTPQKDIFEKDPVTVEHCMKLIREEIKELEEGVQNKDIIEVSDAIGDAIYVLLGMSARIGVNMDKVFNTIHDNNMSKLCATELDAQESVKYYLAHPELGYESPSYRKSLDGGCWVVYNESTKKILKSVTWKPVDLSFIL